MAGRRLARLLCDGPLHTFCLAPPAAGKITKADALRTIDLANPSSAKDLVQTQFGLFYATAARDRIVYTLTTAPAPDPNAAVYSITPP